MALTGSVEGAGARKSLSEYAPNQGLELTAYSVRSSLAPASGVR
jgi:hypothetical protein